MIALSIASMAASYGQIKITEFLAVPDPGSLDDDGDRSGWIELANSGVSSESLDGLYLTDDASNLTKWTLPAVDVAAGGVIVIWSSGKDRAVAGAPLHTSFTLAAAGGYLGLIAADGTTVVSDFSPAYPAQIEGLSYGRSGAKRSGNFDLVPWGGTGVYLVPGGTALGTTWRDPPPLFDDSSWAQGAAPFGFGFISGPNSRPFGTDISDEMEGVNASCYFRFPFVIDTAVEGVQAMTLKLVIDDGYVAYLNGVEVGSANRPATMSWNSRANQVTEGELFTDPIVVDFPAVLSNGTNILSVHGLNISPSNSDFIVDAELTTTLEDISAGAPLGYFANPTPGGGNGSSQRFQEITFDALADTVFGVEPINLPASADSGLPITYDVVSGEARVFRNILTITGAGDVTVRANQVGDLGYFPADSVEQSFNVARAMQSIDFPPIDDQALGGSPLDPGATAISGLAIEYTVVDGPAFVDEENLIQLTAMGTVTVRAEQQGDANWLAAEAVSQVFLVVDSPQSIFFPAPADRAFDAGAMPVTATSTSGLEVLIEVVSGPAVFEGDSLTTTGPGIVTLRATQPGDDNYHAARPVERSFVSGYLLDLQQETGGTIVALPAKAVYAPGEVVSLSVTEDADYRFSEWGGALAGAQEPSNLTMDSHKAVSAEFNRIWQIDLVASENGSVSVEPVKAEYVDGDIVTFTAIPDAGYAFDNWGGAFSLDVSPRTISLSGNISVSAVFEDVEAPKVQIFFPGGGTTNDQSDQLFGSVSDNVEGTVVSWERDGEPQGALDLNGGLFRVPGIVLNPGDNIFRVVAVDLAGNEGSEQVTVRWEPDRTLSLVGAPETQEGKIITLPIRLESLGNVSGMTFVIGYDAVALESLEAVVTGLEGGVSQVNVEVPGEIRVTLALAGVTLPAGELELGSVSFRARSVPGDLVTPLDVSVLDVSGSDGGQIEIGTHTVGTEVGISQRRFTGDINTNDRLDTGDAFLMQRLLAGFDEVRSWDNGLNDLNASGLLDSGDVVRVLRAVVGIDEQPEGAARVARDIDRRFSDSGMRLEFDQNHGVEGATVVLKVLLDAPGYDPGGASFKLLYPAEALLLEDASSHAAGEIISEGSLLLWNVKDDYANQSGSVAFAASSPEPWLGASEGGELATFTFKVQPGAATQPVWEIGLEEAEMPTADGFDLVELAALPAVFIGQPTTFQEWIESKVEPGQVDDPFFVGLDSDPDGDGISNLEEYASGANPLLADVELAPRARQIQSGEDIFMGIEFSHSLTAVDLACRVELGSDLQDWLEADESNSELVSRELPAGSSIERLVLRDLEPMVGRRYFRVKFELVDE